MRQDKIDFLLLQTSAIQKYAQDAADSITDGNLESALADQWRIKNAADMLRELTKAETVVAALSLSAIAEVEHALADRLENPESIYRASSARKVFLRDRTVFLVGVNKHGIADAKQTRACAPC